MTRCNKFIHCSKGFCELHRHRVQRHYNHDSLAGRTDMQTFVKRTAWVAIVCSFSLTIGAFAQTPSRLDVPAGELAEALKALAQQADVELVYQPEQVKGLRTEGVQGAYSASEAVKLLLKGTSLQVHTDTSGAMVIAPAAAPTVQSVGAHEEGEALRLAQADTSASSSADPAAPPAQPNAANPPADSQGLEELEEILVTAQKRIERLQDVPVPVTALNAESLNNSNQLRLQDYYVKVPGLSFVSLADADSPSLTIRGITTGSTANPTVGIVVDDVPIGSSTRQGGGFSPPDVDPSDLTRVEVLRGPQGTLYGASSLGGLLKFVTVDPSVAGVSGLLQGGLTSVRNGDDVGYNLRGAINMPLTDAFAVRASGYTRRDPGYVDDPVQGREGINETDADGGRLSALWRPSENLSLKLSALYQERDRQGTDEIFEQPGMGEFEQAELRGTGYYRRQTQAYSAVLNARLGNAALTSASGYGIDQFEVNLDLTPFFGPFVAQPLFGVAGASQPAQAQTTKASQELRLTMPLGERVDWLLGLFYTHEDIRQPADFVGVDPDTGEQAGSFLRNRVVGQFDEYAVFSDVTFKFTDRFDIQIGGRSSWNEQSSISRWTGPLAPAFFPGPPQAGDSKDNPFTYLVTPRFKVYDDLMVYARFASGYRPGGPNTACTGSVPCEFDADTTENYELGVKGSFFDRKLSLDASVYYIDWQDVQMQLVDVVGFFDNAGKARSRGVELALETRPLEGLTISGWVAWNDAELTEVPTTSLVVAAPGDQLPYTSPVSGNLSLEQEFALTDSISGFAGFSASYVDDRKGAFRAGSPIRQDFSNYTQLDLHAGARFDTWTVNAFVNNVTDKRGVLTGGLDKIVYQTAFNYIQPRTFGLSLSKEF
jgi:iron complex outermembrane recepter protein